MFIFKIEMQEELIKSKVVTLKIFSLSFVYINLHAYFIELAVLCLYIISCSVP